MTRPGFQAAVLSFLAAATAGAAPLFTEVTEEAGILHRHGMLNPDEPLVTDDPEFYGSAAAAVDVDQDGWTDLYVTRHDAPDLLYRNNGDGTFTDILPGSGLETAADANGVVWADFDNDGDQDVFMNALGGPRHYFFLNNGNGRFIELARERGVDMTLRERRHFGFSVGVSDVDRDGWLDFFTTEWGVELDGSGSEKHMALFRNLGAEAPAFFRNETVERGLGLDQAELHGFSAQFSDFDDDGWPDLGLVADFGTSRLFWNEGGTFTEGTEAAGVGTEQNGMGGAVGDYDGDGDLDWFVTSIDASHGEFQNGNRLYRNDGDRRFTDVTDKMGVRDGGWAWGAAFFDAENDGDLDLYHVNGFMPGAPGLPGTRFAERGPFYVNEEGARFEERSREAGLRDLARGQGVVVFDYDRDGDLDLFVTNSYYKPVLYRNDSPTVGDWIRLDLEGTVSNRDGIGARVEVQALPGGPVQTRELTPHNGYLAQSERVVHFGLGDHNGPVHRVSIRWPSGLRQEIHGLSPGQRIRITEEAQGSQTGPQFTRFPAGGTFRRDEPVVLEVDVSGDPVPVLQWYRNGAPIEGVTGSRYFIGKMRPWDAARYHVLATSPLGVVASGEFVLTYEAPPTGHSIARQWNEILLDAVRVDYPDPTVHSRNLFHCSVAMWDAYVAYDSTGELVPYLYEEEAGAEDLAAARREAISYAAYRVLSSRYQLSPGAAYSQADFDAKMAELGYDPSVTTLLGDDPAALGNRIAARVLAYGWRDGANEREGYADTTGYVAVNEPLIFKLPGAEVADPNRWQPLSFDFRVLQNGIPVGASTQHFLGLNWGKVRPFALERPESGFLPLDPGPPPYLGSESDPEFKEAVVEVIRYSSLLDPRLPEEIDVSPGAYYNNSLGTNDGKGYALNPVTGEPYAPNRVLHADYGRCIAEFWADGPDSETPPGHWNTIANRMSERLEERRIAGTGPRLDPLGWDVRMYFALNAALHDAAVAGWGAKRHYDYVRPVTMIRYMAGKGQSSDPLGPSYHPEGLPLEPGLIEVITSASTAPGERHAHLAGHEGEIALYCWAGEPEDPAAGVGGVDWIRALEWMPYQRFSFVTPPFAAYVSGHSTFSRAAAELLTALTGSSYFPGGLETYTFGRDEFLHFERGPSETITLTWATYRDAADEAGLSRLYGGIHVRADDFAGRIMGSEVGQRAWKKVRGYFEGTAAPLSRTLHYEGFRERLLEAGVAETRPAAAPLRDGVPNLLRFVLGAHAEDDARRRLPRLWTSSYPRPQLGFSLPSGLARVELVLAASNDLRQWRRFSFGESLQSLRFLDHGQVDAVLAPPAEARDFRYLRLEAVPSDAAAADELP